MSFSFGNFGGGNNTPAAAPTAAAPSSGSAAVEGAPPSPNIERWWLDSDVMLRGTAVEAAR